MDKGKAKQEVKKLRKEYLNTKDGSIYDFIEQYFVDNVDLKPKWIKTSSEAPPCGKWIFIKERNISGCRPMFLTTNDSFSEITMWFEIPLPKNEEDSDLVKRLKAIPLLSHDDLNDLIDKAIDVVKQYEEENK